MSAHNFDDERFFQLSEDLLGRGNGKGKWTFFCTMGIIRKLVFYVIKIKLEIEKGRHTLITNNRYKRQPEKV